MVAILVPDGIHRHMHRFSPFLGLIGAGGSSAHRACDQDAVPGLTFIWSNYEVVATNRGHFARGSLSHFCARLSLSLSRVLPSSKSEHHATNSSLPPIHHLQALRTGSLGLVITKGTPPQLGYVRSKRFAAVFDDGKCTNLFVSAAPGDPAGDDDPSASLVENVLTSL